MAEPKSLRWRIEDALKRSTLVPDARHVLWVLLSLADVASGVIPPGRSPSYGALARDTGLARSTVVLRVRDLQRAGWISVQTPDVAEQRSRRARNQYRVCLPTGPSPGLVRETDQSEARTSPGDGPPLVRDSDPTGPADGLTTDLDPSDGPARAGEADELWRSRLALAERVAAFLGDGVTAEEAAAGVARLESDPSVKSAAALVDWHLREGRREDLARRLLGRKAKGRRTTLAPVCGRCEGRPGDGPAQRLVPGTNTPCPNCHPGRVSGRAS